MANYNYPKPQTLRKLPDVLQIGKFTLTVEKYISTGRNYIGQIFTGVTGVARTHFTMGGEINGEIVVLFKDVTITALASEQGIITKGRATPVVSVGPLQRPWSFSFAYDGFTVILTSLELTPSAAFAHVRVLLPAGIGSKADGGAASLDLGPIPVTPECQIYQDQPAGAFGPWIVGETSLVVSGTGYIVDLRRLAGSGAGKQPVKGLALRSGSASGAGLAPEHSNTGYLAAAYVFHDATVTVSGFSAHCDLAGPASFHPVNPEGYAIHLTNGRLMIVNSRIISGTFGHGRIELPVSAVCRARPGKRVEVAFSSLSVGENLDLWGVAELGGAFAWGELTRPNAEVCAWEASALEGYFYLPAGPTPTFCPDDGSGFLNLEPPTTLEATAAVLAARGQSGLTIPVIQALRIFSPDCLDPQRQPIQVGSPFGWLRVGERGIDGALWKYGVQSVRLGNPRRGGYVGGEPFAATLFEDDKERHLLGAFAASAVYDSHLLGSLQIPVPCAIPRLRFSHMGATSTAEFVGGDVQIGGGVELTHWKLTLVPSGGGAQAGVISIRTGRILFTAAGIAEPVHFERPFGLTWAELRADGGLGELFFDHNAAGQRFDGLPYVPHRIALSPYDPNASDIYLATYGTIHFSLFGSTFLNIHDAWSDPKGPLNQIYRGRKVTVPPAGEAGWRATDLSLSGGWYGVPSVPLAEFAFPDEQMGYDEASQDGFIGSGDATLAFLQPAKLEATIQIRATGTHIRLRSEPALALDLGLSAAIGMLSDITGCMAFSGPLLECMSLWGHLDAPAGVQTVLLAPQGSAGVEVGITTTPNALHLTAAGDMYLNVANSAVEVSAVVHMLHDFQAASVEGEVRGRLACRPALAGLSAEGQLTWVMTPSSQLLQGRMKVALCDWLTDTGLEGGLLVAVNADMARAWVLRAMGENFGLPQALLTLPTCTGMFGYGQIGFAVDHVLLAGGAELYSSLGAFMAPIPGAPNLSAPAPALPCLVGGGGLHIYGEILSGLVSADAWAALTLYGPVPPFFEGRFELRGCVLWAICGSVDVTAGLNSSGFYLI